MKRIYAVLAAGAVALSLSSCAATPPDQLSDLRGEITAGKECPELFPLLKAIPADTPASEEAQGEMRNIGCYSRSSERTDAERAAVAPNSEWIGVPGGKRVEVSNECLDAAKKAANEVDSEAAELLIRRTLDVCQGTNEWLSALAEHPGIMGMVEGYIPSVTDIEVACGVHPDTAVCADFGRL